MGPVGGTLLDLSLTKAFGSRTGGQTRFDGKATSRLEPARVMTVWFVQVISSDPMCCCETVSKLRSGRALNVEIQRHLSGGDPREESGRNRGRSRAPARRSCLVPRSAPENRRRTPMRSKHWDRSSRRGWSAWDTTGRRSVRPAEADTGGAARGPRGDSNRNTRRCRSRGLRLGAASRRPSRRWYRRGPRPKMPSRRRRSRRRCSRPRIRSRTLGHWGPRRRRARQRCRSSRRGHPVDARVVEGDLRVVLRQHAVSPGRRRGLPCCRRPPPK